MKKNIMTILLLSSLALTMHGAETLQLSHWQQIKNWFRGTSNLPFEGLTQENVIQQFDALMEQDSIWYKKKHARDTKLRNIRKLIALSSYEVSRSRIEKEKENLYINFSPELKKYYQIKQQTKSLSDQINQLEPSLRSGQKDIANSARIKLNDLELQIENLKCQTAYLPLLSIMEKLLQARDSYSLQKQKQKNTIKIEALSDIIRDLFNVVGWYWCVFYTDCKTELTKQQQTDQTK